MVAGILWQGYDQLLKVTSLYMYMYYNITCTKYSLLVVANIISLLLLTGDSKYKEIWKVTRKLKGTIITNQDLYNSTTSKSESGKGE